MTKPSPSAARKWMELGLAEHAAARASFAETKRRMLNTGWYFLCAREAWTGDFGELLALYQGKIGRTTIYRAMEFTAAALAWVVEQNPILAHDPEAQLKAAYHLTLQSPKPLVALLRSMKKENAGGDPKNAFELLPFGLYDEVRYAQKRLGNGPRQVEFDFLSVSSQIELLTHLAEPNYSFKLPEGTSEVQALQQLEQKLDAALGAVRKELETKTTLEV